MNLIFITGPVRSGKSRFAVQIAISLAHPVTYVATGGQIENDAEWAARIDRHRSDRPAGWTTVQTGGQEPQVLRDVLASASPDATIVIDSVGTWFADQLSRTAQDTSAPEMLEMLIECGTYLVDALAASRATIVVVSEETGWSVHPLYPSGRAFRDALGFTNQRLARIARESYLVVCGYALDLKSARPIGEPQ